MHWLVVYANPNPESFGSAVRDRVIAGLTAAGCSVDHLDLYAMQFTPELTGDELLNYWEVGNAHPDPTVAASIDMLRRCDGLAVIYPTWWSGLPAILKGWIDRVFLPGVAFRLNRRNVIRGELRNIRDVLIVTTTGSPWWYSLVLGNAGRRTFQRTIRALVAKRCRFHYLALDRLDTRGAIERDDFLHEVHDRAQKAGGRRG